jgi:hypothetical protein
MGREPHRRVRISRHNGASWAEEEEG